MRVGILGAGQLARMLALAGHPLGMSFVFIDPNPDSCAGDLGDLIVADFDDPAALDAMAKVVDVVTLDFENVPVAAVEHIKKTVPVWPDEGALGIAQDRLMEKQFFRKLGIGTPDFASIESLDELRSAQAAMDAPTILKTRRLGYDGKGQCALSTVADVESAWATLGGQPLILERKVAFTRELSVLVVRSTSGEVKLWPLAENHHVDGILRTSVAPADADNVQVAAFELGRAVSSALDYVGVLAIELFETKQGELLVNEMAPRVHNSGHWTIDGAGCSQFENHLRAICGLPLGSTDPSGVSVMVNWIGAMPDLAAALVHPGVHWHDYAKSPRAGRKVGHATVVARDRQVAITVAEELQKLSPTTD